MESKDQGYFQELRAVVKAMRDAEAVVYPCFITYKKQRYIMTIIRFKANERHRKFEIARLLFVKDGTMEPQLLVTVDNYRFKGPTKEIREFFNIAYDENNMRTFFETLYKSIGSQLPTSYDVSTLLQTPVLKRIALDVLNERSPSNEKDKIYGNHIMRLSVDGQGKQRYRSDYNSQKTNLLYPKIYNTYFVKDKTLSLCYYDKEALNQEEEDILRTFAVNKGVSKNIPN